MALKKINPSPLALSNLFWSWMEDYIVKLSCKISRMQAINESWYGHTKFFQLQVSYPRNLILCTPVKVRTIAPVVITGTMWRTPCCAPIFNTRVAHARTFRWLWRCKEDPSRRRSPWYRTGNQKAFVGAEKEPKSFRTWLALLSFTMRRTGNLLVRKAMRAFPGKNVVGLRTPQVRLWVTSLNLPRT